MSYEDLFISTCSKCQKDIYGVAVQESSSYFHEDCFVCDHTSSDTGLLCGTPLKESQYFVLGPNRFCAACYRKDIASICDKCHGKIVDCKRIELTQYEKYYHDYCFTCVDCPRDNNQISVEDEYTVDPECEETAEYICRECYFKRYPHRFCYYCEEAIQPGVTIQDADNRFYHMTCFTCDRCEVPLNNGEAHPSTEENKRTDMARKENDVEIGHYVTYSGNVYCPSCFNYLAPKCAVCLSTILTETRQIGYKEEVYCENCFNCHKCGRALFEQEFFDCDENCAGGESVLNIECAEKDANGKCVE